MNINGGRIVTVVEYGTYSFGQLDFQNLNYNDATTKKKSEKRKYSAWGAYGKSEVCKYTLYQGPK